MQEWGGVGRAGQGLTMRKAGAGGGSMRRKQIREVFVWNEVWTITIMQGELGGVRREKVLMSAGGSKQREVNYRKKHADRSR
jgi:hypothetical protein